MTKFFLAGCLVLIGALCWADPAKKDLKELQRVQESNAKILAETTLEVKQIREELQSLKGLLEETRYFFQQESEKSGKLLRDFDYRLTGIEERLSLHRQQLEELLSKKPAGAKGAKANEEADYRVALTRVNVGEYREAIRAFDDFLKKYPQSSLADNAQYWKGEALYALRDFKVAIVEFQKVVDSYPQSDKVPGAILKQGFCLFEQQSYEDAKIFLNRVIEKYIKTSEAAEARERIQRIDKLLAQGAPADLAP